MVTVDGAEVFDVLGTETGAGEFEKLVGGGGVVEHGLEDLATEEVGHA